MADLQAQPRATFILSGAMRGAPGSVGPQGPQGIAGIPGTNGTNGVGVPAGGTTGQILRKKSGTAYDTEWVDSGVGGASIQTIAQTAHGFTVGQIIRWATSTYTLAQASSAAVADVVGMVYSVLNADTFQVITEGWVTGLSGLTIGVNFLSPTVAGGITPTDPATLGTAGYVRKPLFTAVSATSGFFHIDAGMVIGSASYGGGGGGGTGATQNVRIATAATSVTDADDIVVQTFAGGAISMQNPSGAMVKKYTIHNATNGDIVISATTINGGSSFTLPAALTVDLLPVAGNFRII